MDAGASSLGVALSWLCAPLFFPFFCFVYFIYFVSGKRSSRCRVQTPLLPLPALHSLAHCLYVYCVWHMITLCGSLCRLYCCIAAVLPFNLSAPRCCPHAWLCVQWHHCTSSHIYYVIHYPYTALNWVWCCFDSPH